MTEDESSPSFAPYDVVKTFGGWSWLRKWFTISMKPKTSSLWSSPTETNVTGTPVATPTVYWVSRFCG